ncbi:Uncharacterised protein [Vibrio cholerae]|nr:Uncharacterised protein [Vibrio cholerae]
MQDTGIYTQRVVYLYYQELIQFNRLASKPN